MSAVTAGSVGAQDGTWASRVHLCVPLGVKAPSAQTWCCQDRVGWEGWIKMGLWASGELRLPLWGSPGQ